MMKWNVYKGGMLWVAHRGFHVQAFSSWDDAFMYAYRHAMAAIHEVP